jgi:hypothetical protein
MLEGSSRPACWKEQVMRKSLFAVVAVTVVIGAMLGSSLVARSQAAARFEYTQLFPYSELDPHAQFRQVWSRVGYRACVAASAEWTCRDFRESSVDAGYRTALSTLGREGWELITPYNLRREQCDAAVAALRVVDPRVRSLRDVTPDLLAAQRDAQVKLDSVDYAKKQLEMNWQMIIFDTNLKMDQNLNFVNW